MARFRDCQPWNTIAERNGGSEPVLLNQQNAAVNDRENLYGIQ